MVDNLPLDSEGERGTNPYSPRMIKAMPVIAPLKDEETVDKSVVVELLNKRGTFSTTSMIAIGISFPNRMVPQSLACVPMTACGIKLLPMAMITNCSSCTNKSEKKPRSQCCMTLEPIFSGNASHKIANGLRMTWKLSKASRTISWIASTTESNVSTKLDKFSIKVKVDVAVSLA